MADKLDWMNKHLVLIRYLTIADATAKENYKIPPDKAELFAGVTSAEEMIFKFAARSDFKAACELLAYIAHRRAAVWWGYRCILSLQEELRIHPAEERDIADIGANLETTVPDWAKVELPPPQDISPLTSQIAELRAQNQELRKMVDPEVLKFVEDAVEMAFQEFKKVHGIHPIDLLKKLGERAGESSFNIDPNSPMFKAEAELKAQLAAVQKETVETIKSVIPPKVPAHQKMLRDNALAAVYRWVAAPDGENSQKCLDVGNECPDTPAGLLSLASFWAYGDLMPTGEQTVSTPPGLAANGLNQVFLLCALHQGGTRKVKERYEEYFRLGIEVLTGADNWEASLANKKMPHEEGIQAGADTPPAKAQAAQPGSPPPAKTAPPPSAGSPPPPSGEQPAYKRWKPGSNREDK